MIEKESIDRFGNKSWHVGVKRHKEVVPGSEATVRFQNNIWRSPLSCCVSHLGRQV